MLLYYTVIIFLMGVALILPILSAGIYLLLVGHRTVQSQRFPPPDYTVFRDTQVLKDIQAIRCGRMVQLLSLLLLVTAGVIPLIIWLIFRGLAR